MKMRPDLKKLVLLLGVICVATGVAVVLTGCAFDDVGQGDLELDAGDIVREGDAPPSERIHEDVDGETDIYEFLGTGPETQACTTAACRNPFNPSFKGVCCGGLQCITPPNSVVSLCCACTDYAGRCGGPSWCAANGRNGVYDPCLGGPYCTEDPND
jgi:hypothetical protein